MKFILSISILLLVINCFAMSVTLQISDKGMLSPAKEIRLSVTSDDGNMEDFDYQQLIGSGYLCFLAESTTHNDFSNKDVEILKGINISQSQNVISLSTFEIKKNNEGKIIAVLLKYLKSDLILYEDIKFISGIYSSDKFKIDERFISEYHEYKPHYDSGKAALDNQDYLESYRQLDVFMDSSQTVTSLSFYDQARKDLEFSVKQQVSRIGSDYNFMILDSAGMVSRADLNSIDSLKVYVNMCDSLFSKYTSLVDIKPHETMVNLTQELEDLHGKKYTIFLQQIYDGFTHYDYRSAKFTNFLGALTEILTSEQNCLRITDPILDINLIAEDSEFLKKIEEFKFRSEFEEFLGMISNTIINQNCIFDDAIMLKLQNLQEDEPEPYYYIFKGINFLYKTQYQEFWTNMVKAMGKCTDSHLLRGIELSILFNDPYLSSLGNTEKDKFEQGMQKYTSGNFADAKRQFELLKNLYPDLAVTYYLLAELAIRNEDEFTAYFEYESVAKYKPEIISDYVSFVKQEIRSGNLEAAYDKVTKALYSHPAWQLYFLLAKIQMDLEDYNDAIETLENYCIKTNQHNYEEYILLGDIYLKLGNQEKARINYMEAGRLDSSDPLYRERMKALD